MPVFPQRGGCLCGDVRYELRDDPVLVYFCHCTDCQTESASAGYLGVVVKHDALVFTRGEAALEAVEVVLSDGREKGWRGCRRCEVRLGSAGQRIDGLRSVDGGTFDDTSWLVPAGHIWTRSAQPWIHLPAGVIQVAGQPTSEEQLAMVRAWRSRSGPGAAHGER
jgi:hypothetical protein